MTSFKKLININQSHLSLK